jgi:ASC-1-like (ASCH) protein
MSGVKSVGALVAKNFSAKFHVQPRYFNFILAGEKTVEGRIAREKYLSLKPGDAIQFLTENSYTDQERVEAQPSYKTLDARVVSLKRFSSFFEMLTFYGLNNCLPGVESLSEGVQIYHGFPGYEADAKALGTVGIELKLDKDVDPTLEC